MKFLCILLIATAMASCGTADNKSKEAAGTSNKSDTTTIDKAKFDPAWTDAITEMADTDDWVVLSDDAQFTLVQVLTSRTPRHYILYAKNDKFDINGLAWMKIKGPSCLDIHVYNSQVDKLNFSIREGYSTDLAFEKLHGFLSDKLLKTPELISSQQASLHKQETERDEILSKYNEAELYLDSVSGANNNLGNAMDEFNSLKKEIRTILNDRNATSADLARAGKLVYELDSKIRSLKVQ